MHAPSLSWISVALLLVIPSGVAACGDEERACPPDMGGACSDPAGRCASAHFRFADGCEFDLVRPGVIAVSGSTYTLSAPEVPITYGVKIVWTAGQVQAGTAYTPNLIGSTLELWIARPHPTNPALVRSSTTREGTLTFSALGQGSGTMVSGTFDKLRLVRATEEDSIDLTVTDGRFSARIP